MTIVSTGEMKIARSGRLKAYLGSCVGLAIFDTKKRVGGLHHILLPEPICSIPESHLSYYASSGIPLFLQKLAEMGCNREDLSASIAGGALIDPSSPQDLSLNIGGRTLEITFRILKSMGIPIKHLETSGLMPFYIMLDADTGNCTIEPIIDETGRSLDTIQKPTLADIKKTMENLQSIPQIALGIAGMITDSNSDITVIANEIRKDQVLSANILRLCNSSYLGLPRRVESIDQAIVYLGDKTLLQIIITAQTERLLTSADKGYSLTRGGLYYHALATARLCERLSGNIPGMKPDLAYTAGLLHDIGKVVLDQYLANAKPLFYRMMMERGEDSRTIEQKVFSIDHNHTGLLLSEHWDLPQVIKDVTIFHHCPEKADGNAEVVHLVHLADALTQKFLPGFIIENLDTSSLRESMDYLSLSDQDIRNAIGILADLF